MGSEIARGELDGLIFVDIHGDIGQHRRVVHRRDVDSEGCFDKLAGAGIAGDATVRGSNRQLRRAKRIGLEGQRQRVLTGINLHVVKQAGIGIALHFISQSRRAVFLVVKRFRQIDDPVRRVLVDVDVGNAAGRRLVIDRIDLNLQNRLRAEAANVRRLDSDVGLAVGVRRVVKHQIGAVDIYRGK